MAPPAKRQKKSDYQTSPQSIRSLDFFFKKQHSATEPKTPRTGADSATPHKDRSSLADGTRNEHSADEDLARRLQEQWHQETLEERIRSQTLPNTIQNSDLKLSHPSASGTEKPSLSDSIKRVDPPDKSHNGLPAQKKATLSLQSVAEGEDTVTAGIPFDENPLTFEPSKYIPDLTGQWTADGGNTSYALLTRCFVLVNSTKSRLKIVDTLVNMLRTIIEGDPESLLPAVWLTTNAISPPYISLELGLGGSAISKGLKKSCGLDNASLKSLYDKHGDPGDVAAEAKKRQTFTLRKPKPLSIKGVYQSMVKIATSKGNGSQQFKQQTVERLLQDCQGPEQSRYIVRTLCQHLRIGAVKTTMLIALSRAFLLSKPPGAEFATRFPSDLAKLDKQALAEVYFKGEELVKASFARRPNYNDLVACLLKIGVSEELLIQCGLTLHIPLRPMLGSITRDLGEMLTKLQSRDFSCEFKYDGQRAQVHCDHRGRVSIFSRHLEDMTDKYPDLVALVPQIRGEGIDSFILEGEVVAVDKESGDLQAFQTLTNRARKDVSIDAVKVDVCLFAFDLMYLNGESLLDRQFRERRSLLRSLFVEIPQSFTWVNSIDATSADSETVLEFFKSAIDIKCEGIMVKVLDNVANPDLVPSGTENDTEAVKRWALEPPATPSKSKRKKASKMGGEKDEERQASTRRKALLATYEPDKRVDSWLKVKKDYSASSDTLDLIPVAAWHGQGRKSQWWSPILLAVRNPGTGSLEAVTKCISGFTDRFYAANKERYAEGGANTRRERPGYVEYAAGQPDVWFEPQEVWEVAFADVTLSPTYVAALGLVREERGLSLRFPRFLRAREDKGIEEASTAEFLAALWRKQVARTGAEDGGAGGKNVGAGGLEEMGENEDDV